MQLFSILLQAPAGGGLGWQNLGFFGLMLVVFYFFMIRPQQKRVKDQKKFVEELQKGSYIVTNGGLHGKVESIEDGTLVINSEGSRMRIEKSSVSTELSIAKNKSN